MTGSGSSVASVRRASRKKRKIATKQNHHYVVGKIEQVDGKEIADSIAVRADPRNQITGSFAAEELKESPCMCP